MNTEKLILHRDRFLGSSPVATDVARSIFTEIENLPIISPHGHTDPAWFAENQPFRNPTELLITPDHYIFRMLYSQGISLEDLGIGGNLTEVEQNPFTVWKLFARHYHLFLGTPSRIWLDHVFHVVFGLTDVLSETTSEEYYQHIDKLLQSDEFLPRNLLDRFNIEHIATTEGALDPLPHHQKLNDESYAGRIISTFRPDDVVDPDREEFRDNIERLSQLTSEDCHSWVGYLKALANRRDYFKSLGATATDHGHPTAATADLDEKTCQKLLTSCVDGSANVDEREMFRAQLLTEMTRMSLDDGLVMQLHAGSYRNHNAKIYQRFGRDKGADIPLSMDYTQALKPLLDKYGNEPSLTLILFTLDESTYARELAPLAGHYPALRLGPAWWFHDSPEGMLRYRQQTTETAGFYNTVGFNDDTRALLSIPARHDLARRIDSQFLAQWVLQHRLSEEQAIGIARDLAYGLAKSAYKLGTTRD